MLAIWEENTGFQNKACYYNAQNSSVLIILQASLRPYDPVIPMSLGKNFGQRHQESWKASFPGTALSCFQYAAGGNILHIRDCQSVDLKSDPLRVNVTLFNYRSRDLRLQHLWWEQERWAGVGEESRGVCTLTPLSATSTVAQKGHCSL